MDRSAKHVTQSYAEQRAAVEGVSLRGIVCPRCGGVTMVTSTKRMFGMVRRYRRCVSPKCSFRLAPTEEKRESPE